MEPYRHRVQYYETDMMGVVHHANYIHWMEEARIVWMDQMGFPYRAMEAQGIVSPVRAVSCKYLRSCTFGDEIDITIRVASFNGVVLEIGNEMVNPATGETVFQGSSEHVFLTREGRFVRLKRELPEFTAALEAALEG